MPLTKTLIEEHLKKLTSIKFVKRFTGFGCFFALRTDTNDTLRGTVTLLLIIKGK